MTKQLFDGNEEEWRRQVEEMLLKHHTDIQRLWKRTPPYPRDWVGELPQPENALIPPENPESESEE